METGERTHTAATCTLTHSHSSSSLSLAFARRLLYAHSQTPSGTPTCNHQLCHTHSTLSTAANCKPSSQSSSFIVHNGIHHLTRHFAPAIGVGHSHGAHTPPYNWPIVENLPANDRLLASCAPMCRGSEGQHERKAWWSLTIGGRRRLINILVILIIDHRAL